MSRKKHCKLILIVLNKNKRCEFFFYKIFVVRYLCLVNSSKKQQQQELNKLQESKNKIQMELVNEINKFKFK